MSRRPLLALLQFLLLPLSSFVGVDGYVSPFAAGPHQMRHASRTTSRTTVLSAASAAAARAPTIQRHDGIRCDCCGMDPIIGTRFTCANVPDVDICGICARVPGQSFSAGGLPFSQLEWRAVSVVETAAETADDNGASAYSLQMRGGAAAAAAPARAAAPATKQLADMVDEVRAGQAILLDVRETNDFEAGHISCAMPAPFKSSLAKMIYPENRDTAVGIELNRRLYVHASDGSSAAAAASFIAEKMGYADVIPLDATFDEIADSGIGPVAYGPTESLFESAG